MSASVGTLGTVLTAWNVGTGSRPPGDKTSPFAVPTQRFPARSSSTARTSEDGSPSDDV